MPVPGDLALRRCLLVGASIGMLLVLVYLGRWLTFWYDEWNFVLDRQDPSVEALLAPHVDHLAAVPVLVYELLMRVFGLGSYWPWLGVLWLCHFGSAALLFRITSNAANPWLGALAAVSLLTLGPAFEDLLHAFQLSFLLSTVFGLLAIDRLQSATGPGRRDAAIALVALALATASSSVGVIFVGLVLAWALLSRRAALLGVAAPVAVAYAAWYLAWRHALAGPIAGVSNPTAPVQSFLFGLGAGVSGLVGLPPYLYAPVGLVIGIAVAVRLRLSRASSLGAAALLALIAMYGLQALFRSALGVESAARSAYLYPAAIFLWIAVADLIGQRRIGRLRPFTIGVVVLAVTLVIASNLTQLVGSGRAMRVLRANELAVLRLISANRTVAGMSLDLTPDVDLMPQVTARRYLVAIARFGEPHVADEADPTGVAALIQPALLNRAALRLFGPGFAPTGVPARGVPDDLVTGGSGEIVAGAQGCVIVPASPGSLVRWTLRHGDGVSVSPSTTLFLGVQPMDLAEAPNSIGMPQGSGRVVMPPALADASPWFAAIDPSVATTICRLRVP
jgi:hypothetical protein